MSYPRLVSRPAAFSLLEVMVVVAILGVMVALAGPNLLTEVQKTTLSASAEQIAAFLTRAQVEAMVTRRCVRIRQTEPQVLVAERLNVFDCDNDPASAPRISSAADPHFLEFSRMVLDSKQVEIIYDQSKLGSLIPSECVLPPGGTGHELRFRPNGRVFSNDGDLTNDDAVLIVSHGTLQDTPNTQKILVNGQGLICVLPRGLDPLGVSDLSCP